MENKQYKEDKILTAAICIKSQNKCWLGAMTGPSGWGGIWNLVGDTSPLPVMLLPRVLQYDLAYWDCSALNQLVQRDSLLCGHCSSAPSSPHQMWGSSGENTRRGQMSNGSIPRANSCARDATQLHNLLATEAPRNRYAKDHCIAIR